MIGAIAVLSIAILFMRNLMLVTKRNGNKEEINLDKIHNVLIWASHGLDNVSVSQVELRAQIQFFEGIKTSDIHEVIIKSAADLISEDTPDYQFLAARLAIFHLRKRAFGRFTPPSLYDHVVSMVDKKVYGKDLTELYSKEELDYINDFIVHDRDLNFSYAAVKQLEGKYLAQNRVTGQLYESPQFMYALIAASLFSDYDKSIRMDYVERFYHACSEFKISLPTPIMAGVRTPTRQFSSCVKIDAGDSLDSIHETTGAIIKYVSQRAGIGINGGRIRALGSEIRQGDSFHTGLVPFYKLFQAAVKSCSQGGVRGGAATLFYPIWHLDVESLLVLKNNRGVEENRVRHIDYGVQFNKLMYERLIKGENISLFSPHDTPGLYDAFFQNQERFEKLYRKYENDPKIRKKSVKAVDLFSLFMQERAGTGRIYAQNVDHCNTHSPFNEEEATVYQSNLCLEIALPTKPLSSFNKDGEIALCTLAAFNLGELTNLNELEDLSDLVVRALDALLDYQNYPVEEAKLATLSRRSLGVGVINYANYLAKNGAKYSDGSGNNITHQLFEAIQFYLLKASMNLAKEQGPCDWFNETKYSKGILPIDTYKKDIDSICSEPLHLDWETLRQEIVTHGLKNSTLTALMPSETSSQISNATNGIEPPRGLVSVKASKDGIMKQVVPDINGLKDKYELLWSIPDNNGYLQLVGIMQKFVDQAISANTNYDPAKFEGGRVPMRVLLQDLLTAYKYGLKTLYYHNTRDGASDSQSDFEEDCEGGSCKI